ncbi:MAG TPA: zinc-ribbon domain-containing protein [Ktedonobacteraceae bacterium]
MSDFVESAKNMVSSAVSRTSWQAQKQLRVRSKQSEIDKLFEQRQELLDELAKVAMNLYQQNKLTDSQLSRLCASIQELDHDTQNREMQLQEIKSEMYPAAQLAPAPTTNYAPPSAYAPPSQGAPQPSAAGPQPRPQSQPQPQICPNCGNPVRPNALYCRTCGAKLR